MFGKSKLKNYAKNRGGFESIVQELIKELNFFDFFIEEIKPTKILLTQNIVTGFNVISLTLKSETEIESYTIRKGSSRGVSKRFSLNNKSQREIASDIINGL